MTSQWTKDWEKRFKDGDVPWEEKSHSKAVQRLFYSYISRGSRVLEVGCGYGTNASWLAHNGYAVDALDISKTAIEHANLKFLATDGINLNYQVADFCSDQSFSNYDCVFDKGVLHSFNTSDSFRKFAERVYAALNPAGYWIDISGSAETPDPPGAREKYELPRLSIQDLIGCIEGLFEVVEIKRGQFGDVNNFVSWEAVFKKRP